MANSKQQKKRIRISELQRDRNMDIRSRVKTYVKNAETAIAGDNPDQAKEAVGAAIVEIDVAERKGVFHKKTAARKKSRLQRKVNVISS